MKAIRFHNYGGPDVLGLEDVPLPSPAEGEVRIRVAGSAFNPVDDGIRGGYLRDVFPVELPHIPASDVSGIVDAVGPGVTNVELGQAVVGFLPMQADGSAAEYVVAPADILASAPTSVPLADAAALPSVALTAWQALIDHAQVAAGERVLINGAGGAVGGYAIQLAKHRGAHVIATASPRSHDRVRSAGADEVIDHTATAVGDEVEEPVDVLLNLAGVGADGLASLTDLVRDGGALVNTVPTNPAQGDLTRDVKAFGVFVRSDAEQLSHLVDLVDNGTLHIDIAERRPLSDLPSVHERAAAGQISGKVVVLP